MHKTHWAFRTWTIPLFLFFFTVFHLLIAPHPPTPRNRRNIWRQSDGRPKYCPAGLQHNWCDYSTVVRMIISVRSQQEQLMLAYVLVTAGLPFRCMPHFSKDHLSSHCRAKFHMYVFNLCYLDLKQSTELWNSLLPQHETDKWFRAKSINWEVQTSES